MSAWPLGCQLVCFFVMTRLQVGYRDNVVTQLQRRGAYTLEVYARHSSNCKCAFPCHALDLMIYYVQTRYTNGSPLQFLFDSQSSHDFVNVRWLRYWDTKVCLNSDYIYISHMGMHVWVHPIRIKAGLQEKNYSSLGCLFDIKCSVSSSLF